MSLGDGRIYSPPSEVPDSDTYTDLGDSIVDGEGFAVRRRIETATFFEPRSLSFG